MLARVPPQGPHPSLSLPRLLLALSRVLREKKRLCKVHSGSASEPKGGCPAARLPSRASEMQALTHPSLQHAVLRSASLVKIRALEDGSEEGDRNVAQLLSGTN